MKILHISGARVWGGNEQQLILNIKGLNNHKTENYIFGINNSPLHLSANENNINFIPSVSKKISKFSNIKQLKQILKTNKFDVIHLHTSDSLTLFYFYNLVQNVTQKIIYSKKAVRGSGSILSKFKYNLKRIDHIICVSEKVKDDLSKILTSDNRKKLKVIHDCVEIYSKLNHVNLDDIRKKYNLSSELFLIGSIANHTGAKDIPNLINSIHILKNKYKLKNFKLIQIGSFSKLTPKIKTLIDSLDLNNDIILTGKIDNAMSLNSLFNIFVISSTREGGPTAALEAMLMKTTIVTTNVGIMSEIIDKENGFICPPNSADDLAESIFQSFTAKNEKIEKIKEFNYNLVSQNFNPSKIAVQLLGLYNK
jgi:glycosyltransferase involved in cell wall biosynthesis